jgi:hypothetical protein
MDVYCKLSHDKQMMLAKYVIWLPDGVMQNMNVI